MITAFFKDYLDPRGRSGRGDLLVAAGLMLAVEILALLPALNATVGGPTVSRLFKCVVILIGLSVTVRRLHDLNLSGWWVMGGATFLCIWTALVSVAGLLVLGRGILIPGSNGHLLMVAMVLLPAVGITLWLHLAQGEPFKNVYGLPSSQAASAKSDAKAAAIPQS